LARELEVKAKAIIDLLPGYGVTEKKTHSSSIPEDVAVKVRRQIKGASDAEAAAEAAESQAKEATTKAARTRPAPAPSAPGPVAVAPTVSAPTAI
jgi:translation initiation factor IF-2